MEPTVEKKHRFNLGWKLFNHLKLKLVAGLLVVIPLGITIFILRFLFNLADGFLGPHIDRGIEFFRGEGIYIPGLGMFAGLVILYITGVFASNLFGSRMVHYGESLFARIPLVKSIYTSTKQLMHVFTAGGKNSYRKAVYVEFPKEGSYSIAFVTSTVSHESGKEYCTVFVPTSPNPTSGYVLLLETRNLYPTNLSVEDALKIVMSGGMVAPPVISTEKLR